MQPSPRAETSSPWRPSVRVGSMTDPLEKQRTGARAPRFRGQGMSTAHSLPGGPVTFAAAARERNRDHRFFTAMALAAALTAFVGFAPSYYLRGFSGAQPLTTLVHIHGALATAWMLLFLTQTALVSSGRA